MMLLTIVILRRMVWKPGKVKGLSIVFDKYVVGTLDFAKNDCALSLSLAKTVLKEAGVIQIWFSHVP